MKLKRYLALTRAGIIEALQFRLGSFVIVVGNLLYLISKKVYAVGIVVGIGKYVYYGSAQRKFARHRDEIHLFESSVKKDFLHKVVA